MFHILFLHASIPGHVSCFHFLVIVISAELVVGKQLSSQQNGFLFPGCTPGIGINGSCGTSALVFGVLYCFPPWKCSSTHTLTAHTSFLSCTSSPTLISCLLVATCPTAGRCHLIVALICTLLMISDIELPCVCVRVFL